MEDLLAMPHNDTKGVKVTDLSESRAATEGRDKTRVVTYRTPHNSALQVRRRRPPPPGPSPTLARCRPPPPSRQAQRRPVRPSRVAGDPRPPSPGPKTQAKSTR